MAVLDGGRLWIPSQATLEHHRRADTFLAYKINYNLYALLSGHTYHFLLLYSQISILTSQNLYGNLRETEITVH